VSRSRAEATPGFVLLPELGAPGERLTLDPDSSHYVARVCRARAGETLSATDGRGALARLELIEVAPRAVARVVAIEQHARTREAIVWCGACEASRADWLVEKLAELGVSAFVPVDGARAEWRVNPARLERWRRLGEAALRQSRRTHLLRIEPPRRLTDLLAERPGGAAGFVADPEGGAPGEPPPAGVAIGVIGPAEGFEPEELDRIRDRGFRTISLADGRLRTETAALAWAAWWARDRA